MATVLDLTGNSISDGGGDMYDGGNTLRFGGNSTPVLPYSNDLVSTDVAGVSYFTKKFEGLFVMAADYGSNTSFDISGNLGADGGGAVTSFDFSPGQGYRAFVKLVGGTSDPSINHLILVPESNSLSQTVPTSTDTDNHSISGLPSGGRIYFFLFSKNSGQTFPRETIEEFAGAFLGKIRPGPPWIEWNPEVSIASGTTRPFPITLDSTDLEAGSHTTKLAIAPEGIDTNSLSECDFMDLTFTVRPPTFALSHNELEIGAIIGAPIDPVRVDLIPGTGSTDFDDLEISTKQPWLNVTRIAGEDAIQIAPNSVGDSSAEISLTSGETRQTIQLKFLLAPLSISHLLADPFRSRLYAINQNGTGQGSVLVIDTLSHAVLRNLPVGLEPTDLALTEGSIDLLVMNTTDPSIHRINLESFETTETIPLSEFSNRNNDVGGHVIDGPGSIIYYVDEQWGPRLRVFDTSTQTVMQTFGAESGQTPNTNNDNGFGDIKISADGTRLFGWRQYGDGAGSSGTGVVRFDIAPDGTLSNWSPGPNLSTPNFQREPFDSPLLMTSDGNRLIIKDSIIDMDSLQIVQRFPDEIYSLTPNGKVAAGVSAFYPEFGGDELLALPGSSAVQTILPDYSNLVYFDQGELHWVNLIDELGIDALGINITPRPGSTVTSPESFAWLPISGVSNYDFYLGTNEVAVAAATPTSPEFLSTVQGQLFPDPAPLTPGTYYWKTPPSGTTDGEVYQFTISSLALDTSEVTGQMIAGVQALTGSILTSPADPPITWRASSDQPWIEIITNTGTSSESLHYRLNASNLGAGTHQGNITLTFDGGPLIIPVDLRVTAANYTHAEADRERPRIYLISQADINGFEQAFLVELDGNTGDLLRSVPCGNSVTDLTIHHAENRIYIPNRNSGILRAFDRDSLTQVQTYQFSPKGAVGYASGDISGVSAGAFGELIINEWDQHTTVSLIDTSNGEVKATAGSYSDGRGVHSPDGRQYYHPLIGTTRAALHKFEVSETALTELAVFNERRYSSPAVISGDGSRIFWGREVLNPELVSLLTLESEVVTSSFYGDLAITSSKIFNTRNGQELATLPIQSSLQLISFDQRTLFIMDGGSITPFDLTPVIQLPTVELQPSIPDGSSVFGTHQELSWSVSPSAVSYDVYLGTDQNAVRNAEKSDPEFLENTTRNSYWEEVSGLIPGQIYHWKIVPIGVGGPGEPSIWSFQISPAIVDPREVRLVHPERAPLPPVTIQIAGDFTWTAAESSPWISLDKNNGSPADQLTVSFDTSSLAPGQEHETSITLTSNGVSTDLPIYLDLRPLNFIQAEGDFLDSFVYAISQDEEPESPSFLIRINSETDEIIDAVPCGSDVSDFTIHYKENRLYLTNYRDKLIRAFDRTSLEQVQVYDEILVPENNGVTTFQAYPLDPYKISSGRAGEIMIEGEDQWINLYHFDTSTGKQLGRLFEREGDGQFSPDGLIYYHGDNNSSGAVLTSHDIDTELDILKTTRDEDFNYYGSRNLRVSGDGSLISWGGSVFSAEQDFLFNLSGANPPFNPAPEVRSISYFGDIVSYNGTVVDVATATTIATLPVATDVQAIPASQDKIYLFSGSRITVFDLGSLTTLPTLQLTPNIADGAVVFGRDQALSWSSIPSASTYQIYFGTDEASVNNASPTSPEYLGESSTSDFETGARDLELGQTYFWRIDFNGPGGLVTGRTTSFTVAPIVISPGVIELDIPKGAPASDQTLTLTTPAPTNWSATASSGITLSDTTGTTDGILTFQLDTTELAAGTHRKTISLTVGADTVDYSISINVFENKLVSLQPGPGEDTVIALTSQPKSQGPSFLMELDASNGQITRFLDAGPGPIDFTVATGTGKIHLLSPDQKPSAVIDYLNWTHLPPLSLPASGVTIKARPNGQLLVGDGQDSYAIHLIDPETSEILISSSHYSVNASQRRPMAVSPDGSTLYTLNTSGFLTAYGIQETTFMEINERPLRDYSANFRGDLHISANGDSLFYQDYRVTSEMEDRLLFPDAFQPVAIDPRGLIAVGEEKIVYARSGVEIISLPYPSTLAAISNDSAFLVRFNPNTGGFDSTLVGSLTPLPGFLPQPGEEVYGTVSVISAPPVDTATSYQLYWGLKPDALSLAQTSDSPNFTPGDEFPAYGKIYWRVDALSGNSTVTGQPRQFSILPEEQSATLSQNPETLNIADGVLTVGSHSSYANGNIWTTPIADDFPEMLPPVASIPQEFGSFPVSGSNHGYAGGRIFTNHLNTIEGYELNQQGGYRKVLSQTPEQVNDRQLKNFTTSGDLIFMATRNATNSNQSPEIQVYRTFPDLVLEQTIQVPNADAGVTGFGDLVAAAGDLMVVADSQSSNSLILWIYRRSGAATTPWLLLDRVVVTDYRYGTANIDTDGKRIALSYQQNQNGISKAAVLEEITQNNFAIRWNTPATALIEGATSSTVFGKIAIDQNHLAITSPNLQTRLNHVSSVLVLQQVNGQWLQQPPISASATSRFGSALAISDGKLFATDSNLKVYRFDLSPTSNRHPLYNSDPPFQSIAGQPYESLIAISDDSPSYSVDLVQAPAWMSLEAANGQYRLIGTAPLASGGDSPVRLKVTDSEGLSTFRTFTLDQLQTTDLPTLSNSGGDLALGAGQELFLNPQTDGIGPFAWQWYLNGEAIEGANGPTFSISQVSLEASGTYHLVATNVVGSTTGDPFELTVNPANRFAGDWPTLGGRASHLGQHPATLGTHHFHPAWTVQAYTDRPVQQAAIADGKVFITPYVYFGGPQNVKAFSLTSGAEAWSREFPDAFSFNPPSYFDGRVFFQRGNHSGDSQLWALDANTGASLWSAPFSAQWERYAAPAINADGIWVNGGSYGGMYGFNHDGSGKFFYSMSQVSNWTPTLQNRGLYSWVSGDFAQHDPESGEVIWSTSPTNSTGDKIGTTGIPVMTPSGAFLLNSNQSLTCIDLETRAVRWTTEAYTQGTDEHRRFAGMPAISRDLVLAIAQNFVVALDRTTGEEIALFEAPNQITSIQPLIVNDHLLVSSNSETYVFDLETRELIQTLPVSGHLSYSNGYLILAGEDGRLHAFFANDVPDINTAALPDMVEDIQFSVPLDIVHHDENETLSVTLKNAPDFLHISDDRVLRGSFETDALTTEYTFEVEVSDGVNPPVSRQYTLNLINVNDPPRITPFVVNLVEDGPAFTIPLFDVVFDEETALDDLVVSMSVVSPRPEGPVTSNLIESGTISITPHPDQFGDFQINLTVRDPGDQLVEINIPVSVSPVPDPPRINIAIEDQSTNDEGEDLTLDLAQAFLDPDPGDVLTYELTGNTNAAIFSNIAFEGSLLRLRFAPYQSGSSELTITATDPGGLTLSQSFTIVLPDLPPAQVTTDGEITFNRRTGLYEQTVTVTNSAARAIGGFDLTINGLTNGYSLFGLPNNSVAYHQAIEPGGSVTLVLEYHSPTSRERPTPAITALNTLPGETPVIDPGDTSPDRVSPMSDGSMLLEFRSTPGQLYQIQYSHDLATWHNSPAIITATANRTQWLDQGLPKTNCHPADCQIRLYRVIEMPAATNE
ncbi:PQQ-binding-like beta-propeller repeat protein [Verrucomicrobiaceae bacterium 227]